MTSLTHDTAVREPVAFTAEDALDLLDWKRRIHPEAAWNRWRPLAPAANRLPLPLPIGERVPS